MAAGTYLYAGNKNANDGTGQLEVASGFITMGQSGAMTAAEYANLSQNYYLATPGSAGEVTTASGPPTVQTITVYDYPGAAFSLTFGGQTAFVASGATAQQVQAALQALSSIGAGNVTVTGNHGGPYTVTFAGSKAGAVQAAIVVSGTDVALNADLTGFGFTLPPGARRNNI